MSYEELAREWFETGGRCRGGAFVNRLFDLLAVADNQNREKLRAAFPELVGAWLRVYEGGTD